MSAAAAASSPTPSPARGPTAPSPVAWSIRDARPSDAATIVRYNAALARETEGRELDLTRLTPGVAALLADLHKGRYFVAELNGEVIGQLMLTYEWSDWRNGMVWWFQSVYVHQEHRSRGVFRSLHRHVETLARNTPGVCGLRLYMEVHNAPARATYLKLGFRTTGYEVFEIDFTAATTEATAAH